jgi:hypothetical protein
MDRGTDSLDRTGANPRKLGADWMGERHVSGQPVSEKRADSRFRAIEKLIGHDDVERRVFLLQTADRTRRDDALNTQQLESKNIRTEVELGR